MKYGNDNSRLTGMIEKAKSELEHMLDLNPQVMMLVDREGRILRANRALLSLLGEENFGSVLGRFVTEIFHCREGLDLAGMINGQAAASCRAEVQSGGLTRVLEFQIVGSGRAGDIFVVIVTDRTADKEFESYLEKRHKKEAVHELMGGLMHAINQPLTIIAVKSQLMDIALSRDSFDIGEFKSNLSDIAGMAIQISDMLQGIASPSDFVTSHYLPGTRIIDLEKSSAKRDSADVNEMVMLRGVLAALEIHDPGASGHGWRTGECAAAIAAGMGMGKSDVEAVQRSGVFHDIGKIAIPDVILQKPGPLTVEEWVIVKKHPETGHKLLSGFAGLRDLADAIMSDLTVQATRAGWVAVICRWSPGS